MTSRVVRRAWLSVVGLLSAGASNCFGQACEMPGLDCSDFPYLQSGQTWIDTSWTPNRLPGVTFQLMNGNYCSASPQGTINESNFRGLHEYWCDPADDPNCTLENGLSGVDVLMTHLENAWTLGFRRFMIYAPAGTVWGGLVPDGADSGTAPDPAGQKYLASSQWWTIPQAKREYLADELAQWIATHQGAWVEIYGSFPTMNNPETRCLGPSMGYPEHYFPQDTTTQTVVNSNCVGVTKIAGCPYATCVVHSPSRFVQEDVCKFDENVRPWQDLGVKRYWLDSAASMSANSNFFPDFIELAHSPLYKDGAPTSYHFLGMESIPSLDALTGLPDPDLGPGVIDMTRATQAPAIAYSNVLESRDLPKNWDVSASISATELVAVLDSATYMETNTICGVLKWAQRGFVLYVANPNSTSGRMVAEKVKRVYEIGQIVRADFNGDLTVDATDLAEFDSQYALYEGMTACNWAHGDNDVDIRDKNKYYGYYLNRGPIGATYNDMYKIDFGSMGPTDLADTLTRPDPLPNCSQ